MTAILAFFTGGIGRWFVLAGTILFAVFMARMHWIDEGREEILKANVVSATRIITLQGKVTTKIITKYRDRVVATQDAAQETKREVDNYAEKNATGMCIDTEFVRLLNRAASGSAATSPGRPATEMHPPAADNGDPNGVRGSEGGDGELRATQPVRGQIRRPAGLEQAAS